MAITMQGNWTLRVKSKAGAAAQRFTVSGADSGNGSYDGAAGTEVFVTGSQWFVNAQHQRPTRLWCNLAARLGYPEVAGGLLRFDISAGHGAGNNAGNPAGNSAGHAETPTLVLTCTAAAQPGDYIVYGTAQTYSGRCLFNPGRNDYIVIDRHLDPVSLRTRFPRLGEVIEKLYPQRLRMHAVPLVHRAPELTPIVIPTGLPNVSNGLVFQPAPAGSSLPTQVRRAAFDAAPLGAGVGQLDADDLRAIAAIREAAIKLPADMARAPGVALRFQEYQRSAAEQQGASYTGQGTRRDLGLAVTDCQGNYLFRFSPALRGDGAGTSATQVTTQVTTQQRPDLIVQVLGSGLAMTIETAPYCNIANLQRIDLCVPHERPHAANAGHFDDESGYGRGLRSGMASSVLAQGVVAQRAQVRRHGASHAQN